MKHTITLIPGDGIGPEITDSVLAVLKAAGADLNYDVQIAGITALEQKGELIPESLIESIKTNKVALKGPLTTPVGKGFKSINVSLRQIFDLYQNIRPCKSIPGVNSRFDHVDLVLFRENTEGLYSGFEIYDERNQIADAIARISYKGSERIIRAAFEYAQKYNRKKVTVVHKANIMKQSSGLFLKVAREVAKDFPDIEQDDRIIDNMCMQLVMYPERYDVVVTTNLFGDILSDLGAGLVGGLGVVPGANLNEECAIFEAVHGTAPDIAGQDKANPTALLLSAVLMLRHLGQHDVALKIESALFETLKQTQLCTRDLGGKCGTKEFTRNIIKHLT
ncbi:MAG: NAD-dependent isocitrate dehydrogenase [Bacteroidetes bacterium]|nr:MAG: NAD-dependent isocitrate dehydrogenase [Bacteroidota bacterium]